MIVDSRESELIIKLNHLKKYVGGFDFSVQLLDLADAVIGKKQIERKAGRDFELSEFDGRMEQLQRFIETILEGIGSGILIIENFQCAKQTKNFMYTNLAILTHSQIQLILTDSMDSTAYYLMMLEKCRNMKDLIIRKKKKKGDPFKLSLEIIPGIGPKSIVKTEAKFSNFPEMYSFLSKTKNEDLTNLEKKIKNFYMCQN